MNESVSTIMTSKLITLGPGQTLGEAREIFITKRIHHIPIVDGTKLVGLITSWDLFKTGLSAEQYHNKKITDVMTTKLAVLEPDDKIGSVAEVLMEHLFHAIPIVDADHNLVGIVTSYDLLRYEFRKEYPSGVLESTE